MPRLLALFLLPVLASGLAGFAKKTSRKSGNAKDAAEEAPYADLRKWCAARGAELKGVRAARARPKLGVVDLVATKACKAGEVLATVPSDLALALADPTEGEADLAQCGANFYKFDYPKAFAEYAATLPAEGELGDHPLLWSDAEVEDCEWPPLAEAVAARKARVAEVSKETGLDEAMVAHGCALVASRAHELRLDAGDAEDAVEKGDELDESVDGAQRPTKSLRVLVPFLDVACWAPRPNVRIEVLDHDKDDSTFALTALSKIDKGDVLSMNYGGSPTTPDLLLNHGFVPPQRLDGSAAPDGRLLSRFPDHAFSDASSAADREVADDAEAPAPKRQAARLRLALKSVKTNKNHEVLFKAVRAQAAGVGPSASNRGQPLPPGTERSRVSATASFGSGTAGG
mmetsp:Transcript_25285/g.75920  ORF Transcript_25285/g.75920 Transcript_25285/m.75920 type:complete len:401 (+) Transcript_25285:172-1374(+)